MICINYILHQISYYLCYLGFAKTRDCVVKYCCHPEEQVNLNQHHEQAAPDVHEVALQGHAEQL
jgi:hypothetical protein